MGREEIKGKALGPIEIVIIPVVVVLEYSAGQPKHALHPKFLNHPSEENSGTSPNTHQNMEFSHIDTNLEFNLEQKISSYTGLIASLPNLFLF